MTVQPVKDLISTQHGTFEVKYEWSGARVVRGPDVLVWSQDAKLRRWDGIRPTDPTSGRFLIEPAESLPGGTIDANVNCDWWSASSGEANVVCGRGPDNPPDAVGQIRDLLLGDVLDREPDRQVLEINANCFKFRAGTQGGSFCVELKTGILLFLNWIDADGSASTLTALNVDRSPARLEEPVGLPFVQHDADAQMVAISALRFPPYLGVKP